MKIYHARLTAKGGLEADGAVEGALAALVGGVDWVAQMLGDVRLTGPAGADIRESHELCHPTAHPLACQVERLDIS